MSISNAGTSCKEAVSSAIISRIESLAIRMEALNDRVYNKLDPVMMPESPAAPGKIEPTVEEVYPPYFDRIRNFCRTIERNIDSIEAALSRTEI